MVAMRSLMVASSVAFALACEDLNGFDQDAYAASLWGGSIGGMVVGVLVIVLMSLPLCCGVLKQYGKVIGAIGIFLGLLALVIPLFGALGSCVPFVDAACNDACTPCTDEEKKIWASACQTLGIVFVYMVVFGWAACVLGIVGASLACCVCCQCCKAKLDDPWVKQGAPPVVVGTAAPACLSACRQPDSVPVATEVRLTEPDAAHAAYRMCTLLISLARRRFQGGALNENSSRDHTNHEALLSGSVDMVAMRSLMVASSVAFALACEDLNGFDQDAYAASLWGGSIGGMVVGILVIVLMSLPLCCGVLKQYGKVIGAIGIVMGVLALVIPLFGALGSCVPFVDAACNDACTPCTDEEKKIWASACQTLGIVFVYMVVFGWAACVLGIVGASLACCVCCQCCKAKLDDPWVKQGAPPVVVGTAAPA
ncbi:unnamed protein product [Cladocopium goreaui]|uniref:S-formylglutathione hydrolase n=1 Tax=Cladocopium goreaui TaxID=2562237 RepID=A0A9P1GK25_9DINO|nr:unnamed protein product [Cladocopium goreaui]